jgi:hypothetical protein
MERIETPALWRKLPVTETPVPVVTAPAPYSAGVDQLGKAASDTIEHRRGGHRDLDFLQHP